jgi:hypothetical protein
MALGKPNLWQVSGIAGAENRDKKEAARLIITPRKNPLTREASQSDRLVSRRGRSSTRPSCPQGQILDILKKVGPTDKYI